MWKSAPELNAHIHSLPDIGKLDALYSASLFWREAWYPAEYAASDEWKSLAIVTKEGATVLGEIRNELDGLPEPDVQLAFFGTFAHEHLLFDYQQTDAERIFTLFERELLDGRLRLPYRFGRRLYDRFNDTYEDTRTDHILNTESGQLLQGTPIGVYQLGSYVSGPLGVLVSQECRWLPPSATLPLWHCSDTGCSAVHAVNLLPPQTALTDAFSRIRAALFEHYGPESEWDAALRWLHRRQMSKPTSRKYADLPVLIGDGILGSERSGLLQAALLSSAGTTIRSALGSPPRKKSAGAGSAEEIASRLGTEEQFQLLLLMPDSVLIELIDDLVIAGAIRVPIGETRRGRSKPPLRPSDSNSELSSLGLRSVRFDAVINLTSVIKHAYHRLTLTPELEWRVKADNEQSTYNALVEFVRTKGPAEAVQQLILSSAQITRAVCDEIGLPLRRVNASDHRSVDLLMWKLGFNPMQFDDSLARFKTRLTELNDTVLLHSPITTELARERVRAAGVNVFVSVEEFIDRLLSYSVWLLSTDHFLTSRFTYSTSDARQRIAQVLGATVSMDDVEVSWSTSGENALGTLLRYTQQAASWIDSLPDRDRDGLLRPTADLPHYVSFEELPFPFLHTALWADTAQEELRRFGEIFRQVARLLAASELASVRNGLDHFREPDRFPSADKLLGCVARLRQALELADIHRFYPKLYWLTRTETRSRLTEYEFRDYAGRSTFAFGPPLVSGLPIPRYGTAYLLAPGNPLGTPNSTIAFRFHETSEYASYWQGYPRRRQIPAAE